MPSKDLIDKFLFKVIAYFSGRAERVNYQSICDGRGKKNEYFTIYEHLLVATWGIQTEDHPLTNQRFTINIQAEIVND